MASSDWLRLPSEIRIAVLEILLDDGRRLAEFSTVSREWQTIIEKHTFSRIKLTSARIAQLNSMITHERRSLVRYIWLCLELPEYDCSACEPQDPDSWGLNDAENSLVTTAFQDLFTALSVWEVGSSLLLDISIYSPSDSEHWFKYVTFEPDEAPDSSGCDQYAKETMLVKAKAKSKITDHHHGWINGRQSSIPTDIAIDKLFAEVMGEGPFDDEEQERQWWQQLPLVPAITGVLLRQQNRRRLKPAALAHMFARLPELQEIHYEPWREWLDVQQRWTDKSLRLLFDSLSSNRLRRLVIFENFDQAYPASYMHLGCDSMRTPCPQVSRAVANASLMLEHLSASFVVEARHFFDARELSWTWPNLAWLAVTSQLLVPQDHSLEVHDMLQAAAAAAMKMPKLQKMDIWNGRKGLATLFRYQRAEGGEPATITWRGTWDLPFQPLVIQAWNSVAVSHRSQGLVMVKELLDAGVCVKSHGDAIRLLKFSRPVIRPVSLRQIEMEHMIREELEEH